MSDQGISRNRFWRQGYRRKRYARHLSQPELNKRIRDVLLNLLRVTSDAKIGLAPINDQSAVWMEKWTHVLEEMQLRFGPFPNGFTRETLHSEPFPDFVSDLATKAAKKMSSLGLKRNDVFIKFGKQMHMKSLYETGALRIQPASFFFDKVHNSAVRDNELTFPLSFALTRDDVVKLVLNPQDVPDQIPEQRVDIQFRSPTDYWLYCVSSSVEPRLFVDFQADSCVIVRHRETFRRMLREASARHLPGAAMVEGPAIYVDPLLPHSPEIYMPLCKHFGYSYQEEYRFCWTPSVTAEKLSHVDVQIGPLRDIADLVVL